MSCVKRFTVHADVFISSCQRFRFLFLLRNLHKKRTNENVWPGCANIPLLSLFFFFDHGESPLFHHQIGRNMFCMFSSHLTSKSKKPSGFCHLGTWGPPKKHTPKHQTSRCYIWMSRVIEFFSLLAQVSMLLLQPKAVCSSSTASIIRHSGLPTSAWTRCTLKEILIPYLDVPGT